MDEEIYKEVYFHQYCKKCKHFKVLDADEPCDECLSEPLNLYSHKPTKWEEDKQKTKKEANTPA